MSTIDASAATTQRARADADLSDRRRLLASSLAVYLVALVTTVAATWRRAGELVFVLDDPYIHLALAENLARHGTFGLEPGVYESASSAPAWTGLLALGELVSPIPGPWLVLLLGVVGSAWVLANLTAPPLLGRFERAPLLVAGLVVLPITLGLVPLTLTGMEHTLHAAVTLQVLVLLPRIVDGSASPRTRAAYYSLLAISALVRFESLFLTAGCALALVVLTEAPARAWRRWRAACASVAAGVAPAALFGLVNLAAGQYAVPNSVAAKSAWGGGGLLPSVEEVTTKLGRDRLLVAVLVLVIAALVFVVRSRQRALAAPLLALTAASGAHLALANVGWFDRYQAYLVIASAGVLLRVVASPPFPRGRTVGTAVGVVLLALALPRLALLTQVPGGAENIHEQQQLMGEFLAEHYRGQAVAVNDLGYVAWAHEGPVVDIAGLGTFEVLEASKEDRADAAFFAELVERRGVRVVAIYEDLFGGIVPDQWVAVETWCLREELVTAADDCVTFYGTDPGEAIGLATALDAFDATLPPTVERFRRFAT